MLFFSSALAAMMSKQAPAAAATAATGVAARKKTTQQTQLAKLAKALSPKAKARKTAGTGVDPQIGLWETCLSIEERTPHLKGLARQRWALPRCLPNS